MSWKVIVPVCALLLAAAPASFAEDTLPTTAPKTKTCDQKHARCVDYCIKSGKADKELNGCLEGCAGMWQMCKGGNARTGSDASTATAPAPVRK